MEKCAKDDTAERAVTYIEIKLAVTKMPFLWKSVKALEQENRQLREEKEAWIQKALDFSKRLHELERKTLSGLSDA